MKNSRLLQLLSTLSKEEIKRFSKYINKRYAGSETPLKIFHYLIKYHPNFNARQVNRQLILQKVLQLNDAPKKRVSNEIHKLSEWLIDFLILEKIKADQLKRDQLSLQIFRERKLDRLFYQKAEAIQKEIFKRKKSVWRYLELMKLNHALYYYSPTLKLKNVQSLLETCLKTLQSFYYLSTLKYKCEVQNRSNILKGVKKMDFDQKAISLPEDILGEGKMSLFEIYAKLHGFTANATPALYQELKTMLYEEHQNIALEDKLILLTYLINFSIKRINSGDLKSIQEAFDLYEFGIEHSILVESGFLTADKFRNILIIACELGKHEWAEKFLRSFIQNVPEEHRSNLTALGEASILFAKEKYSDCLNYLNDVEFKDYGYVLQTKFIRLKCYYELRSEYRRSLDPFIISFDNIVLRNKAIHEETLQSYHNAIKIIRMLLRPKNVKTKNEIMQELESLKFIAGKIWLMKKIQSYDLE